MSRVYKKFNHLQENDRVIIKSKRQFYWMWGRVVAIDGRIVTVQEVGTGCIFRYPSYRCQRVKRITGITIPANAEEIYRFTSCDAAEFVRWGRP